MAAAVVRGVSSHNIHHNHSPFSDRTISQSQAGPSPSPVESTIIITTTTSSTTTTTPMAQTHTQMMHPPSPIVSRKPFPDTPPSSHATETQPASGQNMSNGNTNASSCCPSCGHNFPPTSSSLPPPPPQQQQQLSADAAAQRISDLQAQITLLQSKAAQAVDRLADYEDEMRILHAERSEQRRVSSAANSAGRGSLDRSHSGTTMMMTMAGAAPAAQTSPTRSIMQAAAQSARLSSLRSLLGGPRRNPSDSAIEVSVANQAYHNNIAAAAAAAAVPASRGGHPGTPRTASFSTTHLPFMNNNEPTLHSLQSDLASERNLRMKAETNLTETQMELEELTAQLFGQANEMVAEERRARSKLEERVRILEKREKEKNERLKRLEGRIERVERVRALVG